MFKVNALNAHHAARLESICTGGGFDQHFAFAHDGMVQLADLVALRQVRVEVILAVKGRVEIDLRLEAKAGAHGLFDAEFIDDGQHAGHGGIDEGDVGVGF